MSRSISLIRCGIFVSLIASISTLLPSRLLLAQELPGCYMVSNQVGFVNLNLRFLCPKAHENEQKFKQTNNTPRTNNNPGKIAQNYQEMNGFINLGIFNGKTVLLEVPTSPTIFGDSYYFSNIHFVNNSVTKNGVKSIVITYKVDLYQVKHNTETLQTVYVCNKLFKKYWNPPRGVPAISMQYWSAPLRATLYNEKGQVIVTYTDRDSHFLSIDAITQGMSSGDRHRLIKERGKGYDLTFMGWIDKNIGDSRSEEYWNIFETATRLMDERVCTEFYNPLEEKYRHN